MCVKDTFSEELSRITFDADLDKCPKCGSTNVEVIHPHVKICKDCSMDEVKKIIIKQMEMLKQQS